MFVKLMLDERGQTNDLTWMVKTGPTTLKLLIGKSGASASRSEYLNWLPTLRILIAPYEGCCDYSRGRAGDAHGIGTQWERQKGHCFQAIY